MSCRHAATREVADRKKAENPHEKQYPGNIDLQCPGESKWRDYRASLARNLNRRDCPQGRSLVSVEKSADEISSTGGRRRLSPRPFGPEFEDLDFRPSNANFRHFPRLCNEKPRISENFRFFHAIFKVDILPFRLILKVQFGVQPGRLQHSPGHALPFGQSCTPSNSLILLFFSSTRALERPYIRSTSFASRMNLSTSSYDSSKP